MDWEAAEDFGHIGVDGHFDGHFDEALMAGTAYALFRYGQDQQTEQLVAAMRQRRQQDPTPVEVNVTVANDSDEDRPGQAPINALDLSREPIPESWDDYVGQEPLKRQMQIHIASAKARGERLPHTLLASGYPGVGKTMLARLLAKAMDVSIIELVPPFNIYTLVEAAEQLLDRDILFIDEIHGLANNGKKGAEILLKVLEDGVAYTPDGQTHILNDITIVGATTDRDMLPEPVLDRFKVKPYFQAYQLDELAEIAVRFSFRHNADQYVSAELAVDMAEACRGTPRVLEEMVLAARDLAVATGVPEVSATELLDFLEITPDGLSRMHVHYLTALRQYFARYNRAEDQVEYVVGEAAMQQLLRETKQGIGRLERFLIERGLLDRTPRGRRLTERGIARAEQFIRAGKGASDVA